MTENEGEMWIGILLGMLIVTVGYIGYLIGVGK